MGRGGGRKTSSDRRVKVTKRSVLCSMWAGFKMRESLFSKVFCTWCWFSTSFLLSAMPVLLMLLINTRSSAVSDSLFFCTSPPFDSGKKQSTDDATASLSSELSLLSDDNAKLFSSRAGGDLEEYMRTGVGEGVITRVGEGLSWVTRPG